MIYVQQFFKKKITLSNGYTEPMMLICKNEDFSHHRKSFSLKKDKKEDQKKNFESTIS